MTDIVSYYRRVRSIRTAHEILSSWKNSKDEIKTKLGPPMVHIVLDDNMKLVFPEGEQPSWIVGDLIAFTAARVMNDKS